MFNVGLHCILFSLYYCISHTLHVDYVHTHHIRSHQAISMVRYTLECSPYHPSTTPHDSTTRLVNCTDRTDGRCTSQIQFDSVVKTLRIVCQMCFSITTESKRSTQDKYPGLTRLRCLTKPLGLRDGLL